MIWIIVYILGFAITDVFVIRAAVEPGESDTETTVAVCSFISLFWPIAVPVVAIPYGLYKLAMIGKK